MQYLEWWNSIQNLSESPEASGYEIFSGTIESIQFTDSLEFNFLCSVGVSAYTCISVFLSISYWI